MKNFFSYALITAVSLSFIFIACKKDNEDQILVTDVIMNPASSDVLTVGDTLRLTTTVLPSNATNKVLNWVSSDTIVATVDHNGLVTTRAEGKVTITAVSADGSNKSDAYVLTVNPGAVSVTGVSLNFRTGEIGLGREAQLMATVHPVNAANKGLQWRTTNVDVAPIRKGEHEGQCLILGRAVGQAWIVVTTLDGDFSDSCLVEVVPIVLEQLQIRQTLALGFGETQTIPLTFIPVDAGNKAVTWHSTDPSVATVSQTGQVTAGLAEGTTYIIVTSEENNNITSACLVTVLPENRCNSNTPGFGVTLGTVTRRTPQEWEVGTQIWTDVIFAENCQKTTFNGGAPGLEQYNADCRSNIFIPEREFPEGDLFSWCAIERFKEELCPYPWRIPTWQDFRDLDIALDGNGSMQWYQMERITEKYLGVWGGSLWGGQCNWVGDLEQHGAIASWWSQSEMSGTHNNSSTLALYDTGGIYPNHALTKYWGLPVRCVKDK
jgi:uncharacterized protein (TIGR02145 family)